jgi:hypothetical protein
MLYYWLNKLLYYCKHKGMVPIKIQYIKTQRSKYTQWKSRKSITFFNVWYFLKKCLHQLNLKLRNQCLDTSCMNTVIYGLLYQVNTDKCTHVLLGRHIINTVYHSTHKRSFWKSNKTIILFDFQNFTSGD